MLRYRNTFKTSKKLRIFGAIGILSIFLASLLFLFTFIIEDTFYFILCLSISCILFLFSIFCVFMCFLINNNYKLKYYFLQGFNKKLYDIMKSNITMLSYNLIKAEFKDEYRQFGHIIDSNDKLAIYFLETSHNTRTDDESIIDKIILSLNYSLIKEEIIDKNNYETLLDLPYINGSLKEYITSDKKACEEYKVALYYVVLYRCKCITLDELLITQQNKYVYEKDDKIYYIDYSDYNKTYSIQIEQDDEVISTNSNYATYTDALNDMIKMLNLQEEI